MRCKRVFFTQSYKNAHDHIFADNTFWNVDKIWKKIYTLYLFMKDQ